ncbi:beta-amylase 7 isoform X2 [Spinacia oleracea]|uniref:Beta-amylase n=1 Tax=Spinacia oleracea TaxID=3562 RepID=A0A9R0IJ03_SPIOL|nr:beta-amylase 7 isoform X2 [Spinacia oleracea]
MNVATDMQKLIRSSEGDEEEEMDMDAQEEDDDEEGKNMAAAMMVNMDGGIATSSDSQFQYHPQIQEEANSQGGVAKRPRPLEEKERTKLRERHRRAITARILAGLRRHGNYNLRVRADINDVIAALAREAGWVVLPDGTTFPSQSQDSRPSGEPSIPAAVPSSQMLPQQTLSASFKGVCPGYQNSVEYDTCQMKGVSVPTASPYDVSSSPHSHASSTVGSRGERIDNHLHISSSVDIVANKQVVDSVDPSSRLHEHDFAGTPYIPVYVMLPLGVINMKCELTDPDGVLKQLRILKSISVDGVKVDCWWGIVEAHAPQEYNWNGYKRLFQIVKDLKLKLQVVMSFHECGGNFRDDVCIPLPLWATEIGRSNPDIYFTDKEGRRNSECLSWGIDKERVLKGRAAFEVYFDFMRSFRIEFDEFFEDGIISMVEVGLGPCGDLRYPSFPVKHGWRYPGLGEFQCYDQYMLKSLQKAAEARGHSFWAKGPTNAGFYNSQPYETGFFCNGGEYEGYYGRFFLKWYSQVLVEHGDRILSLAKLAFEGTCIAAKLSGIHWWYKTDSHAAELTAGFYNPCNRDGYAAMMSMLKKHGAALTFTPAEVDLLDQLENSSEPLADPEGLAWQVLNAAWDVCIPVSSENYVPCHSREVYNKMLENAKPFNDPDGRHLLSFTYHRLSLQLMERHNLMEFERFVKKMHGEAVLDPQI